MMMMLNILEDTSGFFSLVAFPRESLKGFREHIRRLNGPGGFDVYRRVFSVNAYPFFLGEKKSLLDNSLSYNYFLVFLDQAFFLPPPLSFLLNRRIFYLLFKKGLRKRVKGSKAVFISDRKGAFYLIKKCWRSKKWGL